LFIYGQIGQPSIDDKLSFLFLFVEKDLFESLPGILMGARRVALTGRNEKVSQGKRRPLSLQRGEKSFSSNN
jgi:hypothetical protein